MIALWHIQKRIADQRAAIIHCPRCHRDSAPAIATDQVEVVKALFVIPIFSKTTTFVRCCECNRSLAVALRARDIAILEADELTTILRDRASLSEGALSIVALLTCVFPIIGVLTSIVALVATRTAPRWARRVAFASTIISGLITAAAMIMVYIVSP